MLRFLPRNIGIWIGSYLKQKLTRKRHEPSVEKPLHVLFCFVDHYEPRWGNPPREQEDARVQYWMQHYPAYADGFTDSDGHKPKHSFFFPWDEYEAEHVEHLASLCERGYGEIEVHLHHDGDTSEGFRKKMLDFKKVLHETHRALPLAADGEPRYAFIHGNWCLNNTRPDGLWCGVENESDILVETGCYVDMTMPSAPSDTQTKTINSVHYSGDYDGKPGCHDRGEPVRFNSPRKKNLMLIQGPLLFNWARRSMGIMPRIENGEIDGDNPPLLDRVPLWVKAGVCVEGKPDWAFVKLHTHGAPEDNAQAILQDQGRAMHAELARLYKDDPRYRLHYVSAREMSNIARAAEDGKTGDPNNYRDYELAIAPRFAQKR
jgi:hypothetical protein